MPLWIDATVDFCELLCSSTSSLLAVTVAKWSDFQGDGDILASVPFLWDEAWMQDRLTWHLAFWSGEAPPALVQPAEAIKCHSCMFQTQCPGGIASVRKRVGYEQR